MHPYLPICSRTLMIRYLLLNPSASPVLRATILIKISSMTAVRLIPFIHPNSIAPTPLLLQKLLHTFYPLLWLVYHRITMSAAIETHNRCFRIIFFHKSCRLFGKDFVCLCPVNKQYSAFVCRSPKFSACKYRVHHVFNGSITHPVSDF